MPKAYGTAGPRAIYPDMCDSRTLARCGLMANALFPRLIVQSDDQGRLHGDSQDMAALCFPKMPRVWKDVPKAMDELATVGAIVRYEVDGEPYVQVAQWWQYQGHMRRAYPSRHPAPDGWEDKVYGLWKGDKGDSDDLPQPAADSGSQPPPSRSLPPVPPQPAATHVRADVRADRSHSIPSGPIPIGSVLPRTRGNDGPSRIDGTKKTKKAEDEETIDRCQAIIRDPDAPDWKKSAARDQLTMMGVSA